MPPANHNASESPSSHSEEGRGPLSLMTGDSNWFEDFSPGRRMRHARGATISEVENNYISKQVMNTAQAHWNEDAMAGSPFGDGRLVFGLITASLVLGLASGDTTENAISELGVDNFKFVTPVHHNDSVYSFTEVLETKPADRPDAGIVRFKHWGVNQKGQVVFHGERTLLMKRRAYWVSR